MREGWKPVRIGDVCTVVAGQSPKGSNYNDQGEGLPFYQGKKHFGEKFVCDPETWTTQVTKEAFAGDILMSVRAPVGPINFSNQHICIGRGLAAIRAGRKVDREFLFYSILSKQAEITGNEGAVFASINKKQIENIQFQLPSLDEQKRIVAILDEAFAGIERAVANTEKNLANARELYESYQRKIFEQESEGWIKKPLGKCFRLKSGDGLTKKAMIPGQFSVFGGNGIAGTHNESNLSGDNVIVGRVGALCGNAKHISGSIWLTDNAFKIVDKKFGFDNRFLTYLLNYKHLRSFARQSAQPVISNSSLKEIELCFPEDENIQREIAELFNSIRLDMERIEEVFFRKLDCLIELKQSLLQKAFSGELTAEKAKNETQRAVA